MNIGSLRTHKNIDPIFLAQKGFGPKGKYAFGPLVQKVAQKEKNDKLQIYFLPFKYFEA